ncbi:MAG TPA: hypothetical protein VNZ49_07370 [Bacteroidia bacterium]|jgi:hypothetical protein|nr:hypothetical protein [Bacteroidia bacterium]
MKKLFVTLSLFAFSTLSAQTKDYVGKWELRKIVTAKGDTIHIKSSDARYITYNFEYNNTFTSFVKEKDEEATGRWGFDFANKTIKIKNPVYTKTKTKIGDYGIVIYMITPINLIESREEKKKQFSYRIYYRVK